MKNNNLKISYYLRTDISTLPPVISQLAILKKLGFNITLVCGYLCDKSKKILDNIDVQYLTIPKQNKIKSAILYLKLIIKSKNILNDADIIWIGSYDTARYYGRFLFKKNKKIIVNIFELYDQFPKLQHSLKKICQSASKVIVPEINRAYIMKFKYDLKCLPVVIPNKPYLFDEKIDENTLEKINKIRKIEKKLIIFQGWFGKKYDRDLTPIVEALKQLQKDFALILIGPSNDIELVQYKAIFKDIYYFGFINPPQHLFVMKEAYIGIACYDKNSLNNIYCAPNKIYEYGSIGLPILCNDIPGLINTVGYYRAGKCVNLESTNEIASAIIEIENKYDTYSANCRKMYDDVDVYEILKNTMKGLVM